MIASVMETIRLEIPPDARPVRIDKYLAGVLDGLSRTCVQRLIAGGRVLIDGRPASRPSEPVEPGRVIDVTLPGPEPGGVPAEDLPIEILYEDRDLVAVNKPPGMTVHPSGALRTGTLVNALLFHVRDLSGVGGELRPGIVHRLDRATSGVMLAAKNDAAHQALSAAFKAREVQKTYWAVVHGDWPGGEGEIDAPVGRHPANRKLMCVRPDGRASITRFRVLKRGLGGMFLEVSPLTGRTHQIRVHMKHIGRPIAGDAAYQGKTPRRGQLEGFFREYPGIGLHARSLRLRHPSSGAEVYFEAQCPAVFQTLLDRMT